MKIEKTTFDGLDAIAITTDLAKMIVVTGMGPRIAWLSLRDSGNLFYWDKKTITRGDWHIMGGCRVWVSRPMGDEAEDTYAVDNEPCTIREAKGGLTITGGMHPVFKIERGFTIRVLDEDIFEVTAFIKNCSDMLFSGGLWCPTCIDPKGGKQFGIPLGDSRLNWDIAKVIIPRAWSGHSSTLNDPQVIYTKDCLVLNPTGVETKRMVNARLGIVGMTWKDKGFSYLQKVEYNPGGVYPVDSNIALYVAPGNLFIEMEQMGSQQTVRPSETLQMSEIWKLSNKVFDWNDADELLEEFEQ